VAGPAVWDRGIWVIAGLAIGGAAEDAIKPILEPAKQNAWAARPFKVLDPATAAAIRARNELEPGIGINTFDVDLADDTKRDGYGSKRAFFYQELARNWPGIATLINLRRRNLAFGGDSGITRTQFRDALRRQGYRAATIDYLTDMLVEHLDISSIANAIQQGFIPNDGILPDAPPLDPNWTTSDGAFDIPVKTEGIDPTNEAAYHGYDEAHLRVLAELTGLPPGEETLLDMWRRGIITGKGYEAGLREGHTKTKWAVALSARFHPLLNPGTLVNLRLRGWITDADYKNRMGLHGYRPEQAEDWFDSAGRPATTRQVMIGLRRGGLHNAPITDTPQPYRDAILQSDIRPEWANILYEGRETYPSAFVVRRLVTDGVWDAAKGADILYKGGWPQDLARDAATAFASGGTATKHPNVVKAENQLWTATHKAFIADEIDDARATTELTAIHADPTVIPTILDLWKHERGLQRKGLTAAQIKKAWKEAAINAETNAAWTTDDALAALIDLGYSPTDAQSFLNI